MKPTVRRRRSASSSELFPVISCPATITLPLVGTSMWPMRLRRVDLPLPEGPATASSVPSSTVNEILFSAWTVWLPRWYCLLTLSRRTISIGGRQCLVLLRMIAEALHLCLPLSLALVLYGPAAAQTTPPAQEIVLRADEARFPREGFEVLINIRTTDNGRPKEERLSLAQRLIGQVSNGDIARANFAGDYKAKLLGSEKLGNEMAYLLDLVAVD